MYKRTFMAGIALALILTACGGSKKEYGIDLNAEAESNEGFPVIAIETTLPDDAIVNVYVNDASDDHDRVSDNIDVTVKDGRATANLTNGGQGYPNDTYNVHLSVSPVVQKSELKDLMGELGENLVYSGTGEVGTTSHNDPNFNYFYRNIHLEVTDSDIVLEKPERTEPEESASSGITLTPQQLLETYIESHVRDNYSKTTVDKVAINEDMGTDAEGDYIALVNLTWDVQNSPETTEEMLQMYSDDLAASIAIDHPEVQEVAIFWQIPYLGSNTSKWSYEKQSDGMHLTDKVLGF